MGNDHDDKTARCEERPTWTPESGELWGAQHKDGVVYDQNGFLWLSTSEKEMQEFCDELNETWNGQPEFYRPVRVVTGERKL